MENFLNGTETLRWYRVVLMTLLHLLLTNSYMGIGNSGKKSECLLYSSFLWLPGQTLVTNRNSASIRTTPRVVLCVLGLQQFHYSWLA